ncbi:MAG: glutaredoxin family protein [Burkholderiaceae bacterium]
MNSWGPRFKLVGCAALLVLGVVAAQAQTVYRIVGPNGKVTFSDKPPVDQAAGNVTGTAGKPVAANAAGGVLPFELRQIIARYPVTLYAGPGCVPCNAGRLLLQGRGIPYTEYTVSSNADIEALQRLSSDNSLPFLTIGGQKIKGFSQAEWTQFLNAANYPADSRLPIGYSFAAAKPLVTTQQAENPAQAPSPAAAPVAAEPLAAPAPPAPAAANPAGIKF